MFSELCYEIGLLDTRNTDRNSLREYGHLNVIVVLYLGNLAIKFIYLK